MTILAAAASETTWREILAYAVFVFALLAGAALLARFID